jgi:site-specific DNA recombinase
VSTLRPHSTLSATSMGRLVLNVLLSFAQFEREIISERTRDKMAATRKKGKWAGGHPLLGYRVDPATARLVVDGPEAARVRAIFELYLEHRALIPVVRELNRRTWSTKRWTTKAGCERVGRRFDRVSLRRLLTNIHYTGRVQYKGALYPGEHPGIIEVDVFERVQESLEVNRRATRSKARNSFGALLAGILRCGPCGCAMTPAHACKKPGKRYRYYTCINAQKRGHSACPAPSVPAAQIEAFVIDQVRHMAQNPTVLGEAMADGREHIDDWPDALTARWASLSADEQARVMQLLVERVDYDGARGKVKITLSPTGMQTFIEESAQPPKERIA